MFIKVDKHRHVNVSHIREIRFYDDSVHVTMDDGMVFHVIGMDNRQQLLAQLDYFREAWANLAKANFR